MRVLNGFRGLAVLLVFTSHTPLRKWMGDFGQPAVYLFFFLSAFLLSIPLYEKKYPLKEFFKKRFFRIYPLYFIITTVAFFLLSTRISTEGFFINLAFLQPFFRTPYILSVTWTLVIEVQFYLLIPLMARFFFAKGKIRTVRIIGAVILVYAFRIIIFPHYVFNMDYGSMKIIDGFIFEVLDIFILGMVLGYFYVNRPARLYRTYTWVSVLITGAFFTTPFILDFFGINRAVNVIIFSIPLYSFYISYFFYFTVINPSSLGKLFENKILDYYALISYSFYLLHLPVLKILRTFAHNDIQVLLTGILAFVLISVLSCLTYKTVEQPFIGLAGRKPRIE